MIRFILLFFTISFSLANYAQFQFSGKVNKDFNKATAYLNIVNDYNKRNQFITENIIQESKIDAENNFVFKGTFLESENKLYKIYIDNCTTITDSKHLLNQCNDNITMLFIANNSDSIHFPLNDLSQMFCSFEYSKPQNIAIRRIDSLQENLLVNLQSSKNDVQRKMIYKNCFAELQKFSKSLNEPLAELYAYHLYADDNSFSKKYYLTDLKTSLYYKELLNRLNTTYPNTAYAKLFKNDLINDDYSFLTNKKQTTNYLVYLLILGLLVSIIGNFILFKKVKNSTKKIVVNYKTALTKQEQKVLETIQQGFSNKETADKLFISLSTVKTHINNIYSKLGISSRKEIAKFFK